jgi:mutual gliding-motility protein MglA
VARVVLKNNTIQAKLVYYGPGLCGKTANLQWVNRNVAGGQELMSLATEGDRTIFFDFMPLELGKLRGMDVQFKLYTVPGQVRYNQTRKMVLKNVDGVVFVGDSQEQMMDANLESLDNLFSNLAELGVDAKQVPIVLQYNKRDLPGVLPPAELDGALNKQGYPTFLASAYTGEGVLETLKEACRLVLRRLSMELPESRTRERAPVLDPSSTKACAAVPAAATGMNGSAPASAKRGGLTAPIAGRNSAGAAPASPRAARPDPAPKMEAAPRSSGVGAAVAAPAVAEGLRKIEPTAPPLSVDRPGKADLTTPPLSAQGPRGAAPAAAMASADGLGGADGARAALEQASMEVRALAAELKQAVSRGGVLEALAPELVTKADLHGACRDLARKPDVDQLRQELASCARQTDVEAMGRSTAELSRAFEGMKRDVLAAMPGKDAVERLIGAAETALRDGQRTSNNLAQIAGPLGEMPSVLKKLDAMDQRLDAARESAVRDDGPLLEKLTAIEQRLDAAGAGSVRDEGPLLERLGAMEQRLCSAGGVPVLEKLTAIEQRLDAAGAGSVRNDGPLLERLEAMEQRISTASAGPLLEKLAAIEQRLGAAGAGSVRNDGPLVERLAAIEERMGGLREISAVVADVVRRSDLERLEGRLDTLLVARMPEPSVRAGDPAISPDASQVAESPAVEPGVAPAAADASAEPLRSSPPSAAPSSPSSGAPPAPSAAVPNGERPEASAPKDSAIVARSTPLPAPDPLDASARRKPPEPREDTEAKAETPPEPSERTEAKAETPPEPREDMEAKAETPPEPPERTEAKAETPPEPPPEVVPLAGNREHQNAARIARVMLADLYLYHKEQVDMGIREGDFYERNKEALADIRMTYESRVKEEIRTARDHLQIAIEEFIKKKRRQLGLDG